MLQKTIHIYLILAVYKNNSMYKILYLDELKMGDKVIIVFEYKPRIVTVFDVFPNQGLFTIVEGSVDVYLDEVAVLTKED